MKTRVLAVIVLQFVVSAFANVIYVDDDASGPDGSSWDNAYTFLQDALANASTGDEIRVAEGIYRPDLGGGNTPFDRYATFNLKNGVKILGGFAGINGVNPDERNIEYFTSVLYGDLLNDDTGDPYDVNRYNNTYNIVSSVNNDSTAILDGFTITKAMAWSNYSKQRVGGGLYVKNGNPTIISCTFVKNTAKEYGGGFCNIDGSPTLIDCIFLENNAPNGGGVCNYSGSARFESCVIRQNHAIDSWAEGGGFYNYSGTPLFLNCEFSENDAYAYRNQGEGAGGYIYNGHPTFIGCKFLKNNAYSNGGCFYIRNGQLTVINSIFSGNFSGGGGGAMMIYRNVTGVKLTNCVLSHNQTASVSGGIHTVSGSKSVIDNCIFWGNEDINGVTLKSQINESNPVINNSCIQYWDFSSGNGNIASNPMFIDYEGQDGIVGTIDDDLSLDELSPCIDSGNNDALPIDIYDVDKDGDDEEILPIDIASSPRIAYDTVDMGAYEFPDFTIKIAIDIKPQSCPNPVNVKSKGVLPVAILGTDIFDVNDVDPDSILLEGISPVRYTFEDVSSSIIEDLDNLDICDCTTKGSPDGCIDLNLKFDTQEVINVLGDVVSGEEWLLNLTGALYDGTPIEGTDCILIKKQSKH